MSATLAVLHVFFCIFLVAVVLLQRGKGAEIGAVFGSGASSTVFGGRGAGNFLTKLTAAAGIGFMLTSFSLWYLGTTSSGDRLFTEPIQEEAPVEALFEEIQTVPFEATPETEQAAPAGEAP